ncbi:ATP-binding protein [Sphingomonas sp. CJ20]
MSHGRRDRRSSLFVRVFALMLVCVCVVQAINFALLIAVQPPRASVYTISQIAEALTDSSARTDLRVTRLAQVDRAPWHPRAERFQLALAMVMGVSPDRVQISFPTPFLQRPPIYDRASVPPPALGAIRAVARDLVVIDEFRAEFRRADGSWLRVEPLRAVDPWRWFLLFWLVLAVVAVAPFAWILARRLARPIGAFAAAAERLGRDPRAAPLTVEGPAEIAEAAEAFNRMQARLNRYVDDRTTVMAAVAHDLRTPLMRLGLRLESVEEPVRAACEHDLREMQAMVSAVMAHVRDAGTLAATRRPLDLRSLAETVVDDMSDRGDPVTILPGAPVVVEGDSIALKTLMTNLVGNAVKYAGDAAVTLYRREGLAVIEVQDSGPGVAPDEIERLFEPFYRGEKSRSRDTGGSGLGLASARAVARAHGGEVTLENRAEGGMVARVTLPA